MHTPPDVPGYLLREVLGRGGCGLVYRATQVAVGRDVAIKIDNRVLATDRDRRRFFREVNAAGRLSGHPHVIGLYDAGALPDGRPYLVMELCTGGSLAELTRARGGLSPDEVREIGVRLADALGAAHEIGVLHRDIKPANILVNRYGMVGLADFGLASILTPDTEQSATREALTPAYAAPEAFALTEPAPSADVYSFGATLYASLTGRPPRFPELGSPSIATILRMHDEPIPNLPWVPEPLMEVIFRSMASDPAARYPDGYAVREALARIPAGGAATTGFVAPPSQNRFISGPVADLSVPVASVPVADRSKTGGGRHLSQQAEARPSGLRLPRAALVMSAVVVFAALVAGGVWAFAPWGDRAEGTAAPRATASAPKATQGSGQKVAGVDYGVPTTTTDCAAAGVGGRCIVDAECWSGMVVIVGQVTIERRACEESHGWETFAIAPLPKDALTSNQQTLAEHPEVRKVCDKAVMFKSRRGSALNVPAAQWRVDVLPPSERAYDDGVRVYRCVANIVNTSGDGTTGSAFTTSK